MCLLEHYWSFLLSTFPVKKITNNQRQSNIYVCMGTNQIWVLSHRINRYLLTLNDASTYVPSLVVMYWTNAQTGRGQTSRLLGWILNLYAVTLPIPSSYLGLTKNGLGASTKPVYQDELWVNAESLKAGDWEYYLNQDSSKTLPDAGSWLTLLKILGNIC